MENENTGNISEWNEGNFKSMRLHEAQLLINSAKINPLRMSSFSQFNKEWNYYLWVNGIVIMFEEGMQKYSPSEYKEVKKLKDEIFSFIESNKICRIINNGNQSVINVNLTNWGKLKELIHTFEYKTKFYNDKHGLSTRNKHSSGLF